MAIYELWFDNDDRMTDGVIINAVDMNDAINKFCVMNGYIDYADYAQNNDIDINDINIKVYSEF